MALKQAREPLTLAYKRIGDTDIFLDFYPPSTPREDSIPVVVYFHAGGLTAGNRTSWFPQWLHDRLTSSGVAFISADYRLIPPSTGHEVLEDVVDVIAYVAERLQDDLSARGIPDRVDAARIAVAGTSAGGMCAYLAAAHAHPRPKVLLSMYGMGGDWLDSHMYTVKHQPFFLGYEILDSKQFSEFFHPTSSSLPSLAGSALSYYLPGSPTPGYPANPRMQLARVYIQEGVLMDYWTGIYEPSFSATIRALLSGSSSSEGAELTRSVRENVVAAIPESARPLFPQLHVSQDWPACFLVHGENDSAVHSTESRHMHKLLLEAGVNVELRIVGDAEHSFDYRAGAADKYGGRGGLYDQASEFMISHLL